MTPSGGVQDSEDKLQKYIYNLDPWCENYNLQISIGKTKVTTLYGKEPVRSNIVIENKSIEQASYFKYLDCDKSYASR